MEGTQRETYWTATVIEAGSADKELATCVLKILERLRPHSDFFQRIRSEGGAAELFVGWFFEGQTGALFDCNLLAQMADLKIDLSLDLYP